MSRLNAHGFTVDVPEGWDARIFRRPSAGEVAASAADGPPAPRGESTHPVVHLSTTPMPADVGDFGSSGVTQLGPDDVFVVVFDYGPSALGTPLFKRQGMPRELEAGDFDPNALQRSLPGQAGVQVFFTEAGRACCLYVVLGSYANRRRLVPSVNQVLAGLVIEPAVGPTVAPTPPPTVLEALEADPDHGRFTRLVAQAGLSDELAAAGPLTLFAPTDEALARVPTLPAIEADRDRIARVVRAHVVTDFVDLGLLGPSRTSISAVSVGGGPIVATADAGTIRVNGVTVDPVRILAGNGSIYPIAGLLEPGP